MTPDQALAILDKAADPRSTGMLTRVDYVNIQRAIEVIAALIKEKREPAREAAAPSGR